MRGHEGDWPGDLEESGEETAVWGMRLARAESPTWLPAANTTDQHLHLGYDGPGFSPSEESPM